MSVKKRLPTGSPQHENRKERIPETGERIKPSHPGEAWKDRRPDRMTSTEALTKDSNKHTGPSREAERCIDCSGKRLPRAKQLQSTGEVHVKGHSVFQ